MALIEHSCLIEHIKKSIWNKLDSYFANSCTELFTQFFPVSNFNFLVRGKKFFQVIFTKNYCSNQKIATNLLEEVIFPYLQKIKVQNGCPKERVSFFIINPFKD